mmetsp:Transcript_46601/g.116089  ORF Transcript_46601/g.116089 Transcript_46601/m.116089 type:complete len:239 (-) Transcript_46601:192-908(-)
MDAWSVCGAHWLADAQNGPATVKTLTGRKCAHSRWMCRHADRQRWTGRQAGRDLSGWQGMQSPGLIGSTHGWIVDTTAIHTRHRTHSQAGIHTHGMYIGRHMSHPSVHRFFSPSFLRLHLHRVCLNTTTPHHTSHAPKLQPRRAEQDCDPSIHPSIVSCRPLPIPARFSFHRSVATCPSACQQPRCSSADGTKLASLAMKEKRTQRRAHAPTYHPLAYTCTNTHRLAHAGRVGRSTER